MIGRKRPRNRSCRLGRPNRRNGRGAVEHDGYDLVDAGGLEDGVGVLVGR